MTRPPDLSTTPRAWLAAAAVVLLAVLALVLRTPDRVAAIAMAALVLGRCGWVINTMDARARNRHYVPWLLFGLSYGLLAISACGSAAQVVEGHAGPGDWLWLTASVGLIVFDRRGRVAT